jgi:hypothetical protein
VEPEIWAALIAGGLGAIPGGLSLRSSRAQSRREEKRQERLTHLENELQQKRSASDARQAYVYEAKKRLYAECEPVIFQAHEMAQDARYRILNLAETARTGGLRDNGSGWLDREDYYFKSTIYLLLAPATMFKLLQRRMTSIDLSLEPKIRRQYELMKQLWFSFAADWQLADAEPELPYDPDKADRGQPRRKALLRNDHAAYWRQGLYRGTLDMATEALIVPASSDAKERCRSMGEYWSAYDDRHAALAAPMSEIKLLLSGFHPKRKPVLWRIFITQYIICGALLEKELLPEDFKALDWRKQRLEESDEVVWGSIQAAHSYVRSRLPQLPPLEPPEEAQ